MHSQLGGPIQRSLARALASRPTTSRNPLLAPTHPQNKLHITDNYPTQPHNSVRRNILVSTLAQRYRATSWMIDGATENGPQHIISKCVRQLPELFAGNEKAKLAKASRWWKVQDDTMALKIEGKRGGNISSLTRDGIRGAQFKAQKGRGRKRANWVRALFMVFRSEFERLRDHAVLMISQAAVGSPYHKSLHQNGVSLENKITIRWIQHFMRAKNIVARKQTGKLMLSSEKEGLLEKTVAYHIGELQRGFESGLLYEDNIENADETHFVFNMDNGKTLGFVGDKHVKYADVVSGGDPITMMVRLSGGRYAQIYPPMIIYKSQMRSNPIRGEPDNVPGVCYRSSPKGWMDGRVWHDWLCEPRAISALPSERQRVLYVNNCSSQSEGPRAAQCLREINTTMQKLPPNSTYLTQPADSFILQKTKEV